MQYSAKYLPVMVGEKEERQVRQGAPIKDESLATPLEEKHNDRTSRDGASNHG